MEHESKNLNRHAQSLSVVIILLLTFFISIKLEIKELRGFHEKYIIKIKADNAIERLKQKQCLPR